MHAYAACIWNVTQPQAIRIAAQELYGRYTMSTLAQSSSAIYAVAPMTVAIEEQVYESVTSTQPRVANGELVAS